MIFPSHWSLTSGSGAFFNQASPCLPILTGDADPGRLLAARSTDNESPFFVFTILGLLSASLSSLFITSTGAPRDSMIFPSHWSPTSGSGAFFNQASPCLPILTGDADPGRLLAARSTGNEYVLDPSVVIVPCIPEEVASADVLQDAERSRLAIGCCRGGA
ncbi:hypothetical protein NDU88_004046 [Pleurodeles waltl]|uniref:Uncharacterized protein n=1 Tax=Pleurodeles waltl TaxID=8319 RepID=A0AAV7UI21_PLEWA|nr:hypothetical protein NDU88_004046 [Pleurodeles waltl]